MSNTTSLRPGTQRANIAAFLRGGNSLTALEALSLFGAYRLAAHIEILRNRDGMAIVTVMKKDITGRSYARYHLDKQVAKAAASLLRRLSTQRELALHA